MTDGLLHDGPVDPFDAARVARIVSGVAVAMGPSGVVDLLGRLPGAVVRPAAPKRFLTAGSPEAVLLGEEHVLVVTGTSLEYQQVVGGVTLHRDRLTAGEVGPRVAELIAQHVRETGCAAEAAVALTAADETVAGF